MAGDASIARVVLRPIANPLPIGFLALAGGLDAQLTGVEHAAGVRRRL